MAQKIKCLLVVDDEEDVCRIISEKFGQCGYKVLTASDAAEGFRKLEEGKPDGVILDIRIPKSEDGLGYLRRLRSYVHEDPKEQARVRKTPVFILTGAGAALKPIFESEGISGFMEKPFDSAVLLTKIDRVLSR